MTHPPIRILRLSRPAPIATAAVFEDYFVEALAPDVEVEVRPSGEWLRAMPVGDLDEGLDARHAAAGITAHRALEAMGKRVARACEGFDFLCPDYDSAPFAALLAAARNAFHESGSGGAAERAARDRRTPRLLLVAHAPGCMAYDLEILAPHLRPGDRIACPSESARRILLLLAPSVEPFLRVIPHPISLGETSEDAGLSPCAQATPARIVALTRLHPTKLLHRAIDALAIFRARGGETPVFEIAGSLDGPAEDAYARTLRARIARHGLEDRVRFVGAIDGPAAKADFLRGARALVNLSVTVEESFGKAPAEALAAGVPAVVTGWDGLPETVGAAGAVVPVIFNAPTGEPDVRAEDVADALERLLRTPPDREATLRAKCLREAERFSPERVRAEYARTLREALDEAERMGRASSPSLRQPSRTILAEVAPFAATTESRAFDLHRREMIERIAGISRTAGGAISPDEASSPPDDAEASDPTDDEVLRRIAATALARIVQHALAGREPPLEMRARIAGSDDDFRNASADEHDFAALLRAGSAATATERSRVLCAHELLLAGELGEARLAVERLKALGCASHGLHYLELEIELALATERDDTEDGDPAFAERLREVLSRGPLSGAVSSAALPLDDPHLASWLRQFARAWRRAGEPGRAIPALREWLRRFPDEPESGSVWLVLAVNAMRDPATPLELAGDALRHARELLPPSWILERFVEEYARHVAEARVIGDWADDDGANDPGFSSPLSDTLIERLREAIAESTGAAPGASFAESHGEFEAIPVGHRGRTFRLRPRPRPDRPADAPDPASTADAPRAPEFTVKTMGPADDPTVAARFNLLAAIHATGFPMPAPLRRIDAEGTAFLLAERVEGTPLSALPPDARRAAWIAALEALARLRGASIPQVPQSPDPPPLRLEDEWLARVEPVASRRPETRALLERLSRSRPAGPLVPTHGDFAEPNLLLADDGRLVLLDWEEAGLACDGFDAGRLLAIDGLGAATPFPRDELIERLRAPAFDAGASPAPARSPGPSPESLAWFEDLALLRMLHRVPELPFGDEMRELIAARIVDRIRARERETPWNSDDRTDRASGGIETPDGPCKDRLP